MTWASDEAYLRGIDVMSEVVQQVPDDAWNRPSPCEGWRALDVLGHVGITTDMGVGILGGSTAGLGADGDRRPGDVVEGDPLRWWSDLAASARDAVDEIDEAGLDREVDTPIGRRVVRDGLRFPAADLFLHAWDIAAAADVGVSIPTEAVGFVRSLGDGVPTAVLRSPGVFGAEVVASEDAGAVDRLLAWTGRDPRWESTTP